MNKKGFTLIELLVVIAIIGILSTIVLASLNTARAKARDTTRKATLLEIQKALEMYYDTYGGYPSSACPTISYMIPPSLAMEPKMKNFIPMFSPDPVLPGSCYNTQYLYLSDQYNTCGSGNNALATTYALYATLEDQSTSNLSNVGNDNWLKTSGIGMCGATRPNFKVGTYN